MKILALCDSPTLTTGFGRVAQNLFKRWARAGVCIDVWGIGFGGWGYKSCPYVAQLFPGGGGGDWASPRTLELFLGQLERGGYTHVFLLQDTFMLSGYPRPNGFPEALRGVCAARGIRSLLYFPVDAPLEPAWLAIVRAVDVAVAYTHFGWREVAGAAELPGSQLQTEEELLEGPVEVEVLPHGVETKVYRPLPGRISTARPEYAKECRGVWPTPWVGPDDFLMVNVNANQRRKDVARSLEVLAALKRRGVPAKLVMHMPETSGEGLSLMAVGRQLGLQEGKDWGHHNQYFRGVVGGFGEEELVRLYNAADLYLTTSLGEGWGLGITEALACGCPVAVPGHTSCAEIAERLEMEGMGERVVVLPTEENRVWLDMDTSRPRIRTAVEGAAERIHWYYLSGRWKERPALNAAVRQWLDWDRIAKEFLGLLRRPKPAARPRVMAEENPAADEGRKMGAEI